MWYLGAIAIALGVFLDAMNVIFAILTEVRKKHFSGFLLVPLICYVVGIALMQVKPILLWLVVALLVHLACFGVLPPFTQLIRRIGK